MSSGRPDLFAEPHGLEAAGIVRPRPDRPLLLIRIASLHSGNGDQRVATADAPFGVWITVERIGTKGPYRQVLRYRSATRYGDGNPLAVIDPEMPEALRRLRLWQPGSPLPRPAGTCPAPYLVGRALWCVPHGTVAPATG